MENDLKEVIMSAKIWSKAQANDWYDRMPWMRGCNYMPPEAVNRIDMWQSLNFERNMASMELDFALMKEIGFNSIRVILEFIVWDQEHDVFMTNFERFLTLAAKYGIFVMVCFSNDCERARWHETPATLGPQHCDPGWHGGRKPVPAPEHPVHPMGYYPELDEPETRERFFAMVREIVAKYAADPRICVWDLCNEPGYDPETSLPLLKRIFEEARKVETIQPMTSGIWCSPLDVSQAAALELSDVVSYHNYCNYEYNIDEIAELRKFGRPLLNTEWLQRSVGNSIQEMFPLFYLEKISCWNWGFTAGMYQTFEPYSWTMENLKLGERRSDYDFTKWMHDLFRPNRKPYDPNEIAIIMKYCKKADERDPQPVFTKLRSTEAQ